MKREHRTERLASEKLAQGGREGLFLLTSLTQWAEAKYLLERKAGTSLHRAASKSLPLLGMRSSSCVLEFAVSHPCAILVSHSISQVGASRTHQIALTHAARSLTELAANFSLARPSNWSSNVLRSVRLAFEGKRLRSASSRSVIARDLTSVQCARVTIEVEGFPCEECQVTRICEE